MEQSSVEIPISSGKMFVFKKSKITNFSLMFPAVNVVDELKILKSILEAEPKLTKSRSGTPLLCKEWLKASQGRKKSVNW